MGLGWRHPVHDGDANAHGWRVHPWMGQPYTWTPCGTCGAQAGIAVLFCTIPDRVTRAYFQTCPTCDGTRWTLQEVHT